MVAGQYHSFAISGKGEMYGWGYNRDYELGVGDNMDRVLPQAVAAPQGHKVPNTHTLRLGRQPSPGLGSGGGSRVCGGLGVYDGCSLGSSRCPRRPQRVSHGLGLGLGLGGGSRCVG